jgi:hypothetical protein
MEEKKVYAVTEKDVDAAIVQEQYLKIGNKTTLCLLILNTGYEVVGTSAPVDPDSFDFAAGKKMAKERAVDQVWGHLGSIIQWQKAINDQAERIAEEAEEIQKQSASNQGKIPTKKPTRKPKKSTVKS